MNTVENLHMQFPEFYQVWLSYYQKLKTNLGKLKEISFYLRKSLNLMDRKNYEKGLIIYNPRRDENFLLDTVFNDMPNKFEIESVENFIYKLFKIDNFRGSYYCLANIIRLLADRYILKKVLERILLNEKSLAKIARSSYYHQNGFDKFVLISNNWFKLRLHIWKPENIHKAQENIHDHRWAFASKILLGSFENQIFVENPKGDIERIYYTYTPKRDNHTNEYELIDNGIKRLSRLKEVNFTMGQIYYLHPNTLHRISKVNTSGCATLILTASEQSSSCRLFAERKILDEETINTPFSRDYVVNALEELMKKLG